MPQVCALAGRSLRARGRRVFGLCSFRLGWLGAGSRGRRWLRLSSVALVACLLALPAQALAFERQWRVGGGAGVAGYSGAGVGPALGAHAGYGLSDVFDLNLELGGSTHWASTAPSPRLALALAGLSYKVDVLEWIPYVLMAGGATLELREAEAARVWPTAAFGGGLDYLPWREVAFGVQVRTHLFVSESPSFSYWTALLRAEYRWGW